MKSIWAPLDYCTGHNVLVSFSQLDQMCYGLFHYVCCPLVNVILIIVITTQDSVNTLFDYIMCLFNIEANLIAGPVVALHGGFPSPQGRSKPSRELLSCRALASGEAPPPLKTQDFCLRKPRPSVANKQGPHEGVVKRQGGGALLRVPARS